MGTIARYGGKVTVTKKGESAPSKQKMVEGTMTIDFPEGDGKAQVSSTRGFKHWKSVSDYGTGGGCTVEASVAVMVKCGQSENEIRAAAKATGAVAEDLSLSAIKEMDEYVNGYMKALSGG